MRGGDGPRWSRRAELERAVINRAAIAMEARQGGDGETRPHPKDDSAGPQDIAQDKGPSVSPLTSEGE
jgi:hypothetical protein